MGRGNLVWALLCSWFRSGACDKEKWRIQWPFSWPAGTIVSYTEIGKTEKMQVYLRLVSIKLETTTQCPNADIKKVFVYMALNLKGNARAEVIHFGIVEYKCHFNQRTKWDSFWEEANREERACAQNPTVGALTFREEPTQMTRKGEQVMQKENAKNAVSQEPKWDRALRKTKQSAAYTLQSDCEYGDVIFGFCNMETNNDLDKNNFKSMVGMDALLEWMEKVKNWRLWLQTKPEILLGLLSTPAASHGMNSARRVWAWRLSPWSCGGLAGGWLCRSELGQQRGRLTHEVLSSESPPFLLRQLSNRKCSLLHRYLWIHKGLGGWPQDSHRAHHLLCQ